MVGSMMRSIQVAATLHVVLGDLSVARPPAVRIASATGTDAAESAPLNQLLQQYGDEESAVILAEQKDDDTSDDDEKSDDDKKSADIKKTDDDTKSGEDETSDDHQKQDDDQKVKDDKKSDDDSTKDDDKKANEGKQSDDNKHQDDDGNTEDDTKDGDDTKSDSHQKEEDDKKANDDKKSDDDSTKDDDKKANEGKQRDDDKHQDDDGKAEDDRKSGDDKSSDDVKKHDDDKKVEDDHKSDDDKHQDDDTRAGSHKQSDDDEKKADDKNKDDDKIADDDEKRDDDKKGDDEHKSDNDTKSITTPETVFNHLVNAVEEQLRSVRHQWVSAAIATCFGVIMIVDGESSLKWVLIAIAFILSTVVAMADLSATLPTEGAGPHGCVVKVAALLVGGVGGYAACLGIEGVTMLLGAMVGASVACLVLKLLSSIVIIRQAWVVVGIYALFIAVFLTCFKKKRHTRMVFLLSAFVGAMLVTSSASWALASLVANGHMTWLGAEAKAAPWLEFFLFLTGFSSEDVGVFVGSHYNFSVHGHYFPLDRVFGCMVTIVLGMAGYRYQMGKAEKEKVARAREIDSLHQALLLPDEALA